MTLNINMFNQNNNWGETIDIKRDWCSLNIPKNTVGTGHVGKLIPLMVREMIPGQSVNIKNTIGIQFNPFVSNLMHRFNATILTYFVPCRLLDPENWENYIQGGVDGKNAYSMPFLDLAKLKEANQNTLLHTALDYLGYPINNNMTPYTDDANIPKIGRPAAYPLWAYNRIYNDHIRPIDLQPEEVDKNNIQCHKALWEWDYFTRGRVYRQRGEVPIVPLSKELTLPHRAEIGVNFKQDTEVQNQFAIGFGGIKGAPSWEDYRRRYNDANQGSTINENWNLDTKYTFTSDDGYVHYGTTIGRVGSQDHSITHGVPTYVKMLDHDLNADGVGMNLNDLMVSMGIMAVLVNNAKITYRYIDFLEQRYGIKRQDARLQMSEYIGKETFEITAQGIVQTSYGDVAQNQTPQGYITAQATGAGNNLTFDYTAQEHGYVISILSIVPSTIYEQGLPRLLQTKTRFEWATPELVNMPARETRTGELFFTQNHENDLKLFNWTDVYNEYRTDTNNTTGLIRPSTPNGLPSYTLCRNFAEAPVFNLEFVQVNADMKRILQYPNEPDFIYINTCNINTAIPLPLQSNPTRLLNL